MVEKEIRVDTADGEMTTFVVHPDGEGPFPVAVVFMDGVGYREQVKANARRFAGEGYYCVAPDLYYRMGEQLSFDMARLASDGMKGPEAERMMKAATSVTPANATADTKAMLAAIASDPAASSGAKVCVGYCLGARVSLHIASALADDFVAAAGIHPGALINDKPDSPHHDLGSVRGELYFAFAEIDRTATPELVDQFREELRRNGVPGVVERMPGVAHGFAMADLSVYNRDAAEHHFERTLDLWRRNLSDEPIDWGSLVEELQALAVSRIGKRAKKITGLLGTAQHSPAGMQTTLKEIGRLTITFVDPVAIDDLVYEMEQRLATRAGIQQPPRRGLAPWYSAIDDPGLGSG